MKQHLMSSVYFAGNAHPSDVHLGWVLSQDNTLVAMADSKEIKSAADIMCDVAKHQGVTLRSALWIILSSLRLFFVESYCLH